MPRLAPADRERVQNAEPMGDGNFEPIPPGRYIATLAKVETKQSSTGTPAWNVEFQNITAPDGTTYPGRQWVWLNLPQDKMPKTYAKGPEKWKQYQSLSDARIAEFFAAFGFTVDSDTDEFVGDMCVLQIGVETAKAGSKQGQRVNRVVRLLPLSALKDAATSGGDSEDEF